MAAGKLDLAKDLKFGTLNALQDTNVSNSGDRRRTSSLSSLNASTAKAYSRDTLRGNQRFNGIIVHKRLITAPRYSDRMSLLQSYVATAPDTVTGGDAGSGNPLPYQNSGRTAYKVYIPELEPRPAPNSATDPILKTYPDVFAAPGREELENLPLGAVVEVSYEDPERLYNPKIVDGNKEQYVLLANYETEQNDLQLMFGNGHKGLMGDAPGEDQFDHKGNLVPGDASGCSDSRTGQPAPRGILDEPIITSTIVPQYGGDPARKVGFIKGKESFIQKVEAAYQSLQTQGIDLIVGDSYRSYETQKKAYMEKGQPGQEKAGDIAHPCKGYHVHAQAIDLEQSAAQKADILAHGPIYQALYAAGLRRIGNEFWHWSVGETTHTQDKIFAANTSGTSPADTFTG